MAFLPIAINSGHSCLCLSWSFVNTFARRPANTMPPATSAAKPATCQLCRVAVGASPPCTTHHKNKSLAIDRASFFLMFVRAPLFPQLFNGKNYIVREGAQGMSKVSQLTGLQWHSVSSTWDAGLATCQFISSTRCVAKEPQLRSFCNHGLCCIFFVVV